MKIKKFQNIENIRENRKIWSGNQGKVIEFEKFVAALIRDLKLKEKIHIDIRSKNYRRRRHQDFYKIFK